MAYKKPQTPQKVGEDYIYPLTTTDQIIHEETGERLNVILLNMFHPVGSLYWSAAATDPGTLFGGTWQRIKDKFILAAGDTYTVGATGGSATHTLTVNEMPSHNHGWKGYANISTGNGYTAAIFGSDTAQSYINAGKGIQAVGGSQAHNNMPPYEVFYCWKRTA